MKRLPRLCSWINVNEYNFKQARITNDLTGEEYYIENGGSVVPFLRGLDGRTDPHTLPCHFSHEEIETFLDEAYKKGVVRYGRWMSISLSNIAYTLIVPKKKKTDSLAIKLLNYSLLVVFLPSLFWGFYSLINSVEVLSFRNINIWGIILGLILGIVLHECGHAIASLCYGGKLYEMGVQISYLIFPGAYILVKNEETLPTIKKIQVIAAGIEANCLISGLSLSIIPLLPSASGTLFFVAMLNIGLVFMNLVLRDENDGYRIISYLFGSDEKGVLDAAKSTILHRINRIKLYKKGDLGIATLFSYILIIFLQIIFPIIVLLDLLGVISWAA